VEAARIALKLHPSVLDEAVRDAYKKADAMIAKGLNPHRLTRDELAAVYLYTMEGVIYEEMNAKLRLEDRREAKPFLLFVRLMMDAASKLPKIHASVLRGLKGDFRADHAAKGEDEFTWWGFSSCTTNLGSALDFVDGVEDKTVLNISAISAVDISAYSAYEQEDEVLLLPGAVMQVYAIKYDEKKKLTTVTMRETRHVFLGVEGGGGGAAAAGAAVGGGGAAGMGGVAGWLLGLLAAKGGGAAAAGGTSAVAVPRKVGGKRYGPGERRELCCG
jgi:hypothetical protein